MSTVKVKKRKNKDGTTSQFLRTNHNGRQRYEFLNHLQLQKVSNPLDRQANKDKEEMARRIAAERQLELAANDYNTVTNTGKRTDVVLWMQSYIDRYTKKDKRMQGALNRFKKFLIEDRKQGLTFARLTELVVEDFQGYLRQHSIGEGASSYFSRFKKMVKHAYRLKLIKQNPAEAIKTIHCAARPKDILTLEETRLLSATSTESLEVKRAFLFSCVTGLRWVDVKNLNWQNVDIKSKLMTIKQSKTSKYVDIPLNEDAIKLLGVPGKDDLSVFDLPSANGANKSLKAWVKRAGIKKKITWDNARHSFGTNVIHLGSDVTVASKLLGHSTLRHTQRYVNTADELKRRATDSISHQYLKNYLVLYFTDSCEYLVFGDVPFFPFLRKHPKGIATTFHMDHCRLSIDK